MKLLRIAAAALNQTPFDWDGNTANIITAIDEARCRKVSLLCLPELCITGYGCEDAFHSAAVCDMAKQTLSEILPHTQGLAVSVGLPLMHTGALYNVSAMLVDGRIAGLVAKQHLAGDGLHYEPRWFKPWPAGGVTKASLAGCQVPLGDLMFDFAGIRVGFEICEDAWVADRPAMEQARRWRRRHSQSQCQPFCVWQIDRAEATGYGSLASLWRHVLLQQLAGQRGRADYL